MNTFKTTNIPALAAPEGGASGPRSLQRRRTHWVGASRTALLLIAALAAAGCESVRYYSHVAYGQLHIVSHRQPIKQLIDDPRTDRDLKEKLAQILEIREFAKNDLFLPVDDNYLNYVDLKRPYVVWNVSAAPEFSLTPKTWHYPIVGDASYRGYFSQEKALAYAENLKNDGYDVYVGGVTAYSTLGWFADPVFNTIVKGSYEATAALIFHELAHQILYVPDDTTFNESFATVVEQVGLRRWLEMNENMAGYRDYLERRRRSEGFIALITKYRQNLGDLYRQDLEQDVMRRGKARIFSSLVKEYESLKSDWGGYEGYDDWMGHQLNNAKLNSVGAYYDLAPDFTRLLESQGGNLAKFYEKCRVLAGLPLPERNQRLRAWGRFPPPRIQNQALLDPRVMP